MNVTDLQNTLIRGILNTSDVSVLEKINNFFKSEKIVSDWWDEISDEEKELIKEGLGDIEKGQVTPWEQVRKETQAMIKNK